MSWPPCPSLPKIMNEKQVRHTDEMQKIARGCISELTKTEWNHPNAGPKQLHELLLGRLVQIEIFEKLSDLEKAELYRYLVVNLLVNLNQHRKKK